MALHQEDVMKHVEKFEKRIEQRVGNLARHTKREESEIGDMKAEVKMLKDYAKSLPQKAPDIPGTT